MKSSTKSMTKLVIDDQLLDFLKSKSRDNPVCEVITNEIENPKDRYRRKDKKHFAGQVNFLGFSQDVPHFISYLNELRWEQIDLLKEDPWKSGLRFQGKAGKVIRKLFTPEGLKQFKDKDIEQFSNLFKSFCDAHSGRHDFELVSGEDIRKYYDEKYYSLKYGEVGSLWSSCMRHDHCQSYFDIFTENTASVSMLVLLDDNKLVLGRALVWWGVSFQGQVRPVMDRIYTVRDSDVEAFKDYAEKEGWLCKADQNCSAKNTFIDKGERIYATVSVDLHNTDFDYYPYLDTFTYMGGHTLWNKSNYGTMILEDTAGGYEYNSVYDDYNGITIDREDAVYCELGGGECHRDDAVFLYYREISAFPNECVWSEIEQRDLAREDAVELADGDYAHRENVVYSNITYENYHLDQVLWSEYHDDYIPRDEAIELENGEYVHQDDEEVALDYYGLTKEDDEEEFSQAA